MGLYSIITNPLDLNKFPSIKRTQNKINSEFGHKLNCALVSFYRNGEVCARLHADDEVKIDQTQPIVDVSLGVVRTVQFVDNKQESFRSDALTLHPSEGSVYTMKAECQQNFRHRVRMNKRVKHFRIGLSFRAFP
jgi:alkylated DNA repair dioxygenase AlkB